MRLNFLVVASLVFVLAACKSSTDSGGNPAPSGLTAPAAGSVFIYHLYETDSVTGARIAKSDTIFDTVTVLATNISQYGETNVMQLKPSRFFTHAFSTFWNYESTGDVSFFNNDWSSAGAATEWITIPLASKGQHSYYISDTTYGGGIYRNTLQTITYNGTSTLTLGSQTFNTESFDLSELTKGTNIFDPQPEAVGTLYCDTKSGMLVRFDFPRKPGENGARIELLSATIK